MPSINRPNAPNRLPSSDFGDLFFKPRQLRTSEAKSPVTTPSPLTIPANVVTSRRAIHGSEGGRLYSSSPLASPAIATTHRRQLHSERSAYWSESSARLGPSKKSPIQSPGAPEAIKEKPTPLIRRISSAASHAPREPRLGFKWTRDFLGGWIEIRVGRPKGSEGDERDERSKPESEEFSSPLDTASSLHLPLSHATTIAESAGDTSGRPLVPENSDEFDSVSTISPLREGLYCRTKRALGLKHGPITPYIEARSRSPTGAVLDRVTSTLRFLPERAFTASSSAATSVTNLSIAAPRKRRNRPGHRPKWSASSSVRDLMMVAPPVGTPEPEAMYTGSDSNAYLAVDLTQPDAPAFLPSEARRINTPPLPTAGSGKSHPRGFFFNYKPPAADDVQPFSKRPSLPRTSLEMTERSNDDHWYRVKLDAIDNEVAAPKEEPGSNVPEHFPNSPLCPRHPKHKSGGTGTCPYHGRNKSTPSDADQTPTQSKTGSMSPVREDWWLR